MLVKGFEISEEKNKLKREKKMTMNFLKVVALVIVPLGLLGCGGVKIICCYLAAVLKQSIVD